MSKMAEGEEKKFVDNYDILRFLGVVHTKIKKEIKEDFVLAKITDERRKEGAINMAYNAYVVREIFSLFERKKRYVWENGKWLQRGLSANEIKRIRLASEELFDCFMNRIYMLMVMNRNVKGNDLAEIIGGVKVSQEPAEEVEEEGKKGLLGTIKAKLKPRKEEK